MGKTTDSREKPAGRGLSFSCCKNSETTYFLKCDFAQKYVLFPFEMGKGEVWHFLKVSHCTGNKRAKLRFWNSYCIGNRRLAMPLASCRIEGNWAVGKGGATERRKHMATMEEKLR